MQGTAHLLVQMTAVAIAIGILAQVIADRLRLPSIVFLLIFGVLVGPGVLGWIDTSVYGAGLPAIVTIAVALILFEGGLQLHHLDLAAVGRSVRNLVTVGAAVTVIGATLAAHALAGIPWPMAFLFGAIVSVTGPTVINPLLDRVRVNRRIDTILRGEGIVIDPIGAVLAVVVLELIVAEGSAWSGMLDMVRRMGTGVAMGLGGGWLLGRVLRLRGGIPSELKNLVVLAWVLALFAASEALAGESGLAAVVIAGMAVRRESIPRKNQLRRFKGELSILFISILFILLSAHLPLSRLLAVGWGGVATVVVLMWVVRPLNVLVSTWRSDLTWRERLFIMWISPRGVVAISIASFIAIQLEAGTPALAAAGLTGTDGEALLALVFLTIAITVLVQGFTAGTVSRALGVHAEAGEYAVVVGANSLGRTLAGLLQRHDWKPLLVDSNPRRVARARAAGLAAVVGNSLDSEVLEEARVDEATMLVALTANQAVNFLVAKVALDEHHATAVYPVLVDLETGAHEDLMADLGGRLAFGRRIDVVRWNQDIDRNEARVVEFDPGDGLSGKRLSELDLPEEVLPILTVRDGRASLCHAESRWMDGDRVVALATRAGERALAEARMGISPAASEPAPVT